VQLKLLSRLALILEIDRIASRSNLMGNFYFGSTRMESSCKFLPIAWAEFPKKIFRKSSAPLL